MAEPKFSVYDQTYRLYLKQLGELDLQQCAEPLGALWDDGLLVVPMFGRPYRVSAAGVVGPNNRRPGHAVSVALCKYLLMCPKAEPQGTDWVSYRDFKDAAPFAGAFENHTQRAVAKTFTGKLAALEAAGQKLGGRPPSQGLAYDYARIFDAFPKVPLLLLFNDADDLFGAHCSILFEKRAEKYLDMECLVIIGWLLAEYLTTDVGSAGAGLV